MEQDAAMTVGPVYRDIAERTGGEMYIGVVGPVRTGKSTLIAGLMEQMVLPFMEKGARRERLTDELPQSGSGRTVTTTQPAFIPGEGAARIDLGDGLTARVRLVDSVGYLIPGALGTQEGDAARMVSTPWSDEDMPFEEAAALGTRKVMEDHATVGVVVTCDGTVADLPRSAYVQAEETVIRHHIPKSKEGAYYALPFEVPSGVGSVTVSYEYPAKGRGAMRDLRPSNTVDLGLCNEKGEFLGWSGSAHKSITVGAHRSSPGYLTCPVNAMLFTRVSFP